MSLYNTLQQLSKFTDYPSNLKYSPNTEQNILDILSRNPLPVSKEQLFTNCSSFRALNTQEQNLVVLLIQLKELLK